MIEKSNHNNLFDFIRVLFTISVVISHASGTIYQGQIVSANVAVDGFFMLSGLFMARHLSALKNENPEKVFLNYQMGRIKRLFPMYALSCLTGVFVDLIFHQKFEVEKWPALYFMGDINGIPGFWVTWYVAALFWAGLAVSALLVWKRTVSVLVVFPLIFFFSFSYMHSHHNLWLYSEPLIGNFLSAGLVKALCALCVGAETFYAASFFKDKKEKLKPEARKIAAIACEIAFLAGFASSFWIWFSPKNFLVYLYVPLILMVLLLEEQTIFKIFDFKIFSYLGRLSYAVYLTHLYFIKFISKTGLCLKAHPAAAYCALVPAVFLIGLAYCKVEKIIAAIFKKLFLAKAS